MMPAHEKTPASSNIQVWGLDKITSGTIDSVAYDDGAYILVNYNQSSDKEVQGFYDVQEAESFVGAQTQIWYNASQHTIDGTTYDDALTMPRTMQTTTPRISPGSWTSTAMSSVPWPLTALATLS